MSRKIVILLAVMVILAIPAFSQDPGTVTVTVTVGGAPWQNAVVGVKSSPNAAADANSYYTTGADGTVVTGSMPGGSYYVGAWVDGFAVGETAVDVNGDAACTVAISGVHGTNVALNGTVTGLPTGNTNPSYPPYVTDGNRNSDWYWVNTVDGSPGPKAITVDLGSTKAVCGALIDWQWYAIADGYSIQYAKNYTDSTPPAIDDVSWTVDPAWYTQPVGAVTDGFFPVSGSNDPGPYEPLYGPTASARYWRVYSAGSGWFGLREFELYSADTFSTVIMGRVFSGPGTETPVYNAVVQVGGPTGTAAVSLPDGAYSVSGVPGGSQEVYSDGLGFSAYKTTATIATDGSITAQDIHLTANPSEANLVSNGDFEDGTTGWAAGAGHPWYGGVLYPHGTPWGNDWLGNPFPDPNSDQYLVGNLAGQGFGGSMAGGIQSGTPQPDFGQTPEIYLEKNQPDWWGTISTIEGASQIDIVPTAGWDLNWWYNSGNPGADWNGGAGVYVKQSAHDSYGDVGKLYAVTGGSNDPKYMTIDGDLGADGFDLAGGQEYYMARMNARHWYWGWVTPDSTHQIAVDPTYMYNVYFKVKSNAVGCQPYYRILFRNSDGIQLSGDGGGIATGYPTSSVWTQVVNGMVRVTPPSDAATLDLEYFITDSNTNNSNHSGGLLVDDIVVDQVVPPAITGTVTLNGTPAENAVVCFKTAPNAAADPAGYVYTQGDGTYSIPANPGSYYVAAWIDGYRVTEEGPVTVDFGLDGSADIDVTNIQGPNFALGKPSLGLPVDRCDDGGGNLWWRTLVTDGNRSGEWFYSRTVDNTPGPTALSVDLGSDKLVTQMLFDWIRYARPLQNFEIQYAVDGADPGLSSTDWQVWYTAPSSPSGGFRPYGNSGDVGPFEAVVGPATSARYWRIRGTGTDEQGQYRIGMDEWEIYSSVDGTLPGMITITVTDGVNPISGAYVGLKSSPGATADPDTWLAQTDGSGQTTTAVLPGNTYYVGAFVDLAHRVGEAAVLVNGDKSVTLTLTAQHEDLALGKATYGANKWDDGRTSELGWIENWSGNGWWAGALTDDNWDTWAWVGDRTVPNPQPMQAVVDLGGAKVVDQSFIRFHPDVAPWGYKIQYADGYTSNTPPAIDDASWHDWYSHTGQNSMFWSGMEAVAGTATTARYWRIWGDQSNNAWGSNPTMLMGMWKLFSAKTTGTISGTVTAGGNPVANAVVGVKLSPSATADADYPYAYTDGDGNYSFTVDAGAYYVGVWASGYRIVESQIAVDENSTTDHDVALTDPQSENLALWRAGFGTGTDWDGTTVRDVAVPDNNEGFQWPSAHLDDHPGDTWTYFGNRGLPWGAINPMAIGVDLGSDKSVDQVTFRTHNTVSPYGYRIQYASGSTLPAFDSPAWTDWYVTSSAKDINMSNGADGSGGWEGIKGPATTGRYWRLWSDRNYGEWNNAPVAFLYDFEVFSSSAVGTISGTITTNGAPAANAIVALRAGAAEMADADYYFTTGEDGTYTGSVDPGTYSVGVWADGFKIVEDSTTVDPSATTTYSPDLTDPQDPNAAAGKPVFGWNSDGPMTNANLVDGNRAEPWGSWGGSNVSGGCSIVPGDVGVDLGMDKSVSQMLISFNWDELPWGYKVQYAYGADAVDGHAPAIDSASWHDWYVQPSNLNAKPCSVVASPAEDLELFAGTPVTARFWRVWSDRSYWNVWGWQPAFIVYEMEIYSPTPDPGIGYFKTLADGESVTIMGKPVTFSPTTGGGVTGDYFYIEDADRTSGIRVQNSSQTGTPTPAAGSKVSLTGSIESDLTTGERVLAIDTLTVSGTGNVTPIGAGTRAINEDPKLAGMLIRTAGVIRDLDHDNLGNPQCFWIADGYTKDGTEVWTKCGIAAYFGDPSLVDNIVVGDFVKLTGVVSQENPATKLILIRSISFAGPQLPTPPNPANAWTCGFESSEGFTLGNVNGQGGWSIITSEGDPVTILTQAGGAATVVASPDPVMGGQSLKLYAQHTDSDSALKDMICVAKATTEDALNWMVIKFNVWRTPGTIDLPETPGWPGSYTFPAGTYPAIQTNYSVWFSKDAGPWGNGGLQWDYNHETYPLGAGHTPTIAGAFVPVTLYMDFNASKAWSWYNESLVDNNITFTPSVAKFSDFEFLYYCFYPATPGEFGRPAYLDNISASWSTTSD